MDFGAEIIPPPFVDSLKFESNNTGLPTGGLWQMNFVRDDIDEDGIDDLVFPPSRKGIGQPAIYKGLPDAGFRLMSEAGWLRGIPYDYGGVATGDFDGDGHRDIVLGDPLQTAVRPLWGWKGRLPPQRRVSRLRIRG